MSLYPNIEEPDRRPDYSGPPCPGCGAQESEDCQCPIPTGAEIPGEGQNPPAGCISDPSVMLGDPGIEPGASKREIRRLPDDFSVGDSGLDFLRRVSASLKAQILPDCPHEVDDCECGSTELIAYSEALDNARARETRNHPAGLTKWSHGSKVDDWRDFDADA